MKKKAGKNKVRKGAAKRTREPDRGNPHPAAPPVPAETVTAPDPPLLSRFRQLVERAAFELRLADDIARSMKFDARITRPLFAARRHLSACLSKIKAEKEARKW